MSDLNKSLRPVNSNKFDEKVEQSVVEHVVIKEPQRFASLNDGIIIKIDSKFVELDFKIDMAQHIGAFRGGHTVKVKFGRNGNSAPIINCVF